MYSTPHRRSSFQARVALLLLLGLSLASYSPAQAPPEPDSDSGLDGAVCIEGTGKPALELTWKGLPDDAGLITPSGSVVSLTLQNNTGQTLWVDLAAAAVLDDRRETLDLGLAIVAAGAQVSVPVDLQGFGVAPKLLDFAGRIAAKGVARTDNGAPVAAVVYSPHAFFHEERGRLYVYRRTALLEDFGAGDFADRARRLRAWAEGRGLQLMGVGYYDPDLPLSDDDGGPPDGDPTHGNHHQPVSFPTSPENTP